MKFCECGCGKKLDLTVGRKEKRYLRGHRVNVRNEGAEARKNVSSWNKGIPRTDEEKALMSKNRKGKSPVHLDDSHKKAISLALKGRKIPWINKIVKSRELNPNYEITKTQISNTMKLQYKAGQRINHFYIDGRWKNDPDSAFNQYGGQFTNELKQLIRKRDNWICCLCGKKRSTTVHHIDYDKLNNSEFNLLTLCKICHPKHHALSDVQQLKEQLCFKERLRVLYEGN